MPVGFYIGLGATVLLLGAWIVFQVLQHRVSRTTSDRPLASADRDAVLNAHAYHETATAGQMASMASAQRQ